MTTTTQTGKVYLTVVDQWLDTIPASDSEDFREFAEATPSIIEIWVYAGIVGYTGSFNDLSRWVKMKFKKLSKQIKYKSRQLQKLGLSSMNKKKSSSKKTKKFKNFRKS